MFSHHRFHFLVNSHYEYHVKSCSDHFLFGWIFPACLDLYSPPVVNCLSLSCTLKMMLQPSLSLSLSLPLFPSPLFFFPYVWPDSDAVGACPNTGARAEPAVWEGTGWKTPQRIRGHQGNRPPLALPAEQRACPLRWCSWCLALGFFLLVFVGLIDFGLNLGFPDFLFGFYLLSLLEMVVWYNF